MEDNKQSAQVRANQKWAENNREHKRYLSARSSARSFIKNKATVDDLLELESLIEQRRNLLCPSQRK